MTAEQLLWAWIKSEILMPKRLVFKSDCLYYQAVQPAIAEGCKRQTPPQKAHGQNRQSPKWQIQTETEESHDRIKQSHQIAEHVTAPEARH